MTTTKQPPTSPRPRSTSQSHSSPPALQTTSPVWVLFGHASAFSSSSSSLSFPSSLTLAVSSASLLTTTPFLDPATSASMVSNQISDPSACPGVSVPCYDLIWGVITLDFRSGISLCRYKWCVFYEKESIFLHLHWGYWTGVG